MIEPILRRHAPYDFDEADAFLSANDDELRLEEIFALDVEDEMDRSQQRRRA